MDAKISMDSKDSRKIGIAREHPGKGAMELLDYFKDVQSSSMHYLLRVLSQVGFIGTTEERKVVGCYLLKKVGQ
jgi:hypothetical protein